jgi:NACHT domain
LAEVNTISTTLPQVRNISAVLANKAQQVVPQGVHPPHAISAAFESLNPEKLVRCLEGTRIDILDRLDHWIGVDGIWSADVDPEMDPRIFWINGSAGTGKTTIAYTVAEASRKRGILGASFFCSRDYAERSNPHLIFTTIAYQLGIFYPPFMTEVTRALQLNPDIVYSSVPYQLEELIVKPLHAVAKSFPFCVVVLDALDECNDSGTTSIILSSLSRHIPQLSRLKILITSRPQQNITVGFKSQRLDCTAERLILHEIELGIVQRDIELYLNSNLSAIREYYGLESSWPSEAEIQALAALSNGLFIFAATSVNFIQDRNYSSPREQLEDLLRNSVMVAKSSSSPHRHLDRLYTQVLNHAFPDISPGLGGRLKMVLGTIIFLRDPLSPLALEELLNLTRNTVRETLIHLQSVVIVPENDGQTIRLLHPSFFDFMTNLSRCQNAMYAVNAETQHALLARTCLQTFRGLRRDICGIGNPCILNSEVEDLPARITRTIPDHIQYACRHWAWHLTNASVSDILIGLVDEFCSKHMLYWVEVCSLLGGLRNTLIALRAARQFLVVGYSCFSRLDIAHSVKGKRHERDQYHNLTI